MADQISPDQLSLEGLLNPKANSGSSKEASPEKSIDAASKKPFRKAVSAGVKVYTEDPSITERINNLAQKNKLAKASEVLEVFREVTLAASKETVIEIKREVVTAKAPTTGLKVKANLSSITEVSSAEVKDSEDSNSSKEDVARGDLAKSEPTVLTVSDLNRSIKGLLEKTFPFLWVKGEISNLKIPGSGHMYFTLKDSQSQIRAIMFRGFAQSLKFKPEDGMEVLVRCRVTAYEPRGDYQLFCEVMEPVGYGALQVAFEKLKEKLQLEGLFDAKRKRPMPAFPSRIGIITSPTGAAIRDMLNVLSRRFGGGLNITILPASVQGDKAPGELVRQIELANKMGVDRFDVLIIGRGGGSLEDLWAFNTEEVVRAVSRSLIPTISAVGHEVDFTICDFVADLRAPTPSAAAELVVKNKKDLVERVGVVHRQLTLQMQKKIQMSKMQVIAVAKRLVDPKRRLQDLMLRCDEWSDRLSQAILRFIQDNQMAMKFLRERLGSPTKRLQLWSQRVQHSDQRMTRAMEQHLKQNKHDLSKLADMLNGLSPLAILGRGYSIVKKGGEIIKDAAQVQKGDLLTVKFHQGDIKTEVK